MPVYWRHSKLATSGKRRLPYSASLRSMTTRLHEVYTYQLYYGKRSDALQRCTANDGTSCTARLLISDAETDENGARGAIDAICNLFEGGEASASRCRSFVLTPVAATKAKMSRKSKDSQLFPTIELDWFSRNSYNLALKSSATWEPRQTLRLLQASIKVIIQHYFLCHPANLAAVYRTLSRRHGYIYSRRFIAPTHVLRLHGWLSPYSDGTLGRWGCRTSKFRGTCQYENFLNPCSFNIT